ncbi:MAG: exo-alpha-sialidase [Armatimonadetes bacterium]|nr:exo-alpha-sialidase [Armatimonadota bacterium]
MKERVALLALLTVALGITWLRADEPYEVPGWLPERGLPSRPGQSLLSYNFARCLAVDDRGQAHVVWYEPHEGTSRVCYRRSEADGWGREIELSEASAIAEHPSIAVSGSMVYAVWHDRSPGGPWVFFRCSRDGGETWEEKVRLSSEQGGGAHPSLAVFDGSLHVVWGDRRSGYSAVHTRRSSDKGRTWSPERRLSEGPVDSWVAGVTASGRNVYVSWVDLRDGNEEEYIKCSADDGATWGPDTRLTCDQANSWAASVAAQGDSVHLAWFDQKDAPATRVEAENMLNQTLAMLGLPAEPVQSDVYQTVVPRTAKQRCEAKHRQIEAALPNWVPSASDPDRRRLQQAMRGLQESMDRTYEVKEGRLDEIMEILGLAYDGSVTQRVYYEEAVGPRVQDKMQQIQSAAPGWVRAGGDPQQLEGRLRAFMETMQRAQTEWEIYYRRSEDRGATWGPALRLTISPGVSHRPSVCVDGNDVHIVWWDARDGNDEVYYKRSTDGGNTWGPDLRLTRAAGDSQHPTVAVSGGAVHVLWHDTRWGAAALFYRRSAGHEMTGARCAAPESHRGRFSRTGLLPSPHSAP